MASDSKRKDILQAVVATLAGIDGTGEYLTDFSATDQVSFVPFQSKARSFKRWIWVHDGEELFDKAAGATSPRVDQANFGTLLDITLQSEGTATMVEQLNDVLHDIHRAINTNPSLGIACTETVVDLIDIPIYKEDHTTALVTVHLLTQYTYTAATEI